jgi:hypothetical protein
VPALEARPDVPLWLLPAVDAVQQIGVHASWRDARDWSDYYGIELEWLWPVLARAAHMLDEHKEKQRKATSASTPRSAPDRSH